MKKNLLFLCLLVFQASTLFAQVPNAFSYQGVARDISGLPLAAKTISIRASIINTSSTGTAVYVETHNAVTNAFGLFTLSIGLGTPSTGTFAAIDWSVNTKFLMIEMDVLGGSNYTLAGTTQILSVPYAQYAKNSTPQTLAITGSNLSISGGNSIALPASSGGKTFVTLSGSITDAEAVTKLANEAGANTQVISIVNCTQLTTVDLSTYTSLYSLTITENTALTSVNLSGLQEIANDLIVENNASLTSLSLPALTLVGSGISITHNSNLSTINLPNLETANLKLEAANLQTANLPALTTLSISKLTKGQLKITGAPLLTSLSLPLWNGSEISLTYTGLSSLALPSAIATDIYISNSPLSSFTANALIKGTINITNITNISSLNFPAFTTITAGGINIYGLSTLNNVSLPVLSTVNGNLSIIGALSSANVNAILAKLVGCGPSYTGGNINLSQTPSAAPTGQGLTDKTTLTNRGNNVITN
jgi:hypothetical protein